VIRNLLTLLMEAAEGFKVDSEELEKILGLEILSRKDSSNTLRINLLIGAPLEQAQEAVKAAEGALSEKGLTVIRVVGGAVVAGNKGTKVILQGSKEKRARGRPKKELPAEAVKGLRFLVTPGWARKKAPQVYAFDQRGEIRTSSIQKVLSGTKARFEVERVSPYAVSIVFEPITITATSEREAEFKVGELAQPVIERLMDSNLTAQVVDIEVEGPDARSQAKVKVIIFASALKREASFDWRAADGILLEISSLLTPTGSDPIGKIDKKIRDKVQHRFTAKHLRRRVYKRRSERRPTKLTKSVPRAT
jgi:hypothetical protein